MFVFLYFAEAHGKRCLKWAEKILDNIFLLIQTLPTFWATRGLI